MRIQEPFPERTGWSDWCPLPDAPQLDLPSLCELLDGGQNFHWYPADPDGRHWQGWIGPDPFQIRLAADARLHVRGLDSLSEAYILKTIGDWIGPESLHHERIDCLPWRSDTHLRQCIEAFPGLRILRQDPATALLAFICSANKQIPQIKNIHLKLTQQFGLLIAPGIRRPPDWEILSTLTLGQWQSCGTGYRAPYLLKTAALLKQKPSILSNGVTAPIHEARNALLDFPGVGPKVAECILLYGCHRLECFPLDTWIRKALIRHYHLLDGWTDKQVLHFTGSHFGPFAGLAQQFLFAWERKFGNNPAKIFLQ